MKKKKAKQINKKSKLKKSKIKLKKTQQQQQQQQKKNSRRGSNLGKMVLEVVALSNEPRKHRLLGDQIYNI